MSELVVGDRWIVEELSFVTPSRPRLGPRRPRASIANIWRSNDAIAELNGANGYWRSRIRVSNEAAAATNQSGKSVCWRE